jgi:hypothetical protein
MAMVERIVRNAIVCVLCKEEIESVHRHDFKWCKCGKVAVDGGKDYRRRCGESFNYIDISDVYEENVRMSWEV